MRAKVKVTMRPLATTTSLIRTLALSLFAWSASALPASAGGGYVVKREHLACVLDNLDSYRASKLNPVLIFLDRCPEPPAASTKELQMNPQQVPELRSGNRKPGEPESVLALTKKELDCMARLRGLVEANADDKNGIVTLPASICE